VVDERQNWSWTAGGRIGYLVVPQLLAFFSAGYTQAHYNDASVFGLALPGAFTGAVVPAHTFRGWFFGSGYEYGLTWWPGLFWKTEYRFASYSSDRLTVNCIAAALCGAVGPLSFVDEKKWVQTIRSELVWRFNWGGPVRAAY
jgi:outer membrane immunogenic protein